MNFKTKEAPQMRYSTGWAILSKACTRTTVRRINEGLVDDANWRGEVLLDRLVGMIRGSANPKQGGEAEGTLAGV